MKRMVLLVIFFFFIATWTFAAPPRYVQAIHDASRSVNVTDDFYAGMTAQEFNASVDRKLISSGWKREKFPAWLGKCYTKVIDNDVMQGISYTAYGEKISSYAECFYVKSQSIAQEMYKMAYVNFSSIAGQPETIATDGDNIVWEVENRSMFVQLICAENTEKNSVYPYVVKIIRSIRNFE